MHIGIDVDGVVADQISGVLPLIEKRHDLVLTYADVTEWRLPIGDTDIAKEIILAQTDRNYVLKMHVHEGAKQLLDFLHQNHLLSVITARQGDAATTWLEEWLRHNKLVHDDVIAGSETKKSDHRTDVLIDDYLGNISDF